LTYRGSKYELTHIIRCSSDIDVEGALVLKEYSLVHEVSVLEVQWSLAHQVDHLAVFVRSGDLLVSSEPIVPLKPLHDVHVLIELKRRRRLRIQRLREDQLSP
jgi:hypothetical protein